MINDIIILSVIIFIKLNIFNRFIDNKREFIASPIDFVSIFNNDLFLFFNFFIYLFII